MLFDTKIAEKTWRTKYRYQDESPLETFERVAESLAEVESDYGATEQEVKKYKDKFLKTLVNFEQVGEDEYDVDNLEEDIYIDLDGQSYKAVGLKCTPGGRITANIGTDYEATTLLNCFIASPVRNAVVEYIEETDYDVEDFSVSGSDKTPDDLTNILVTLLENAQTLKSEGGWGINFGFIRPRASYISGTGTRHPGVVSYMEMFNKISSVIVRGCEDGYEDELENFVEGNPFEADGPEKTQSRKGAMLAALPVWHPDVEEFVKAKKESGYLDKFNISVLVDDKFMEAVENGDKYELYYNGKTYKKVDAKSLYDLIIETTYDYNDPGVLFFDNMNRNNPMLYLGPDSATNPCGEIGGSSFVDKSLKNKAKSYLKPYIDGDEHNIGRSTVCLLGSVNLTQYVTDDREFDWEEYRKDVKNFTRMLDNVNDAADVPLDMYENALENVRQFGMGINGLGSTHFMLGIDYGSEKSLEFTEKVNREKENLTLQQSAKLAGEKQPAPLYDEDWLETPYAKNANLDQDTYEMIEKNGLRNLKTTTNPPLGSSSLITDNVSNGIEPVFSKGYKRTFILDKWPEGLNQDNVKEILDKEKQGKDVVWKGEYNGNTYVYDNNRGLCQQVDVKDYGYAWVEQNYPEDIDEKTFSTAEELSVDDHIEVQSKVQKWVNQSVSKTTNVPQDYNFDDFKDIYKKSWERGLVGVTTYRAGTQANVLEVDNDKGLPEMLENNDYIKDSFTVNDKNVIEKGVDLPNEFVNSNTKIFNGDGSKYYCWFSYLPEDKDMDNPIALWVSSNHLKDKEYVSINRAVRSLEYLLIENGVDKKLVSKQVEKISDDYHPVRLGKMVSMALRHNISLPKIVEEISGIEGDYVASTLSKVRKYLKQQIEDGTEVDIKDSECDKDVECDIVYEAGCKKCRQCGKSECG